MTPARDDLSPEKLQAFAVGLSGLPPEEIRKAKLLYVRNAITDYQALLSQAEALKQYRGGCLLGLLLGRMARAQDRVVAVAVAQKKQRIKNAIDVWRDDLRGERFDFGDGEAITA
jgi:hypothetical protein